MPANSPSASKFRTSMDSYGPKHKNIKSHNASSNPTPNPNPNPKYRPRAFSYPNLYKVIKDPELDYGFISDAGSNNSSDFESSTDSDSDDEYVPTCRDRGRCQIQEYEPPRELSEFSIQPLTTLSVLQIMNGKIYSTP